MKRTRSRTKRIARYIENIQQKHRYFALFMACYNCTPANCNHFKRYCQMTQLSEQRLQIRPCRNLKKIHNDCAVSCGQTRLIFHCLEQLTYTTLESAKVNSHAYILRGTRTSTTCYSLLWFYLGNDGMIANMCCLKYKFCCHSYLVLISLQRHLSQENKTNFFSQPKKNPPLRERVFHKPYSNT